MCLAKLLIIVLLGILMWRELHFVNAVVHEQKEGFHGGGGGHRGHHGISYGSGGSGGGGVWYNGWWTAWNPVWVDYGLPPTPPYWWYPVEPDCTLTGCPRGAMCVTSSYGSPYCGVLRKRRFQ